MSYTQPMARPQPQSGEAGAPVQENTDSIGGYTRDELVSEFNRCFKLSKAH